MTTVLAVKLRSAAELQRLASPDSLADDLDLDPGLAWVRPVEDLRRSPLRDLHVPTRPRIHEGDAVELRPEHVWLQVVEVEES